MTNPKELKQGKKLDKMWSYVVPLMILCLILVVSGFYAVFYPNTTNITKNYFTGFFLNFNGYTEDSGNLLAASLNVLSAMGLVFSTMIGLNFIEPKLKHTNLIFIAMWLSQEVTSYIIISKPNQFQGGVSLFQTDCLITIIAILLIAIGINLYKWWKKEAQKIKTIPIEFVFTSVFSVGLILLLVSGNAITYVQETLEILGFITVLSIVCWRFGNISLHKNDYFSYFVLEFISVIILILFSSVTTYFSYLGVAIHDIGFELYVLALILLSAEFAVFKFYKKKHRP